MSARDTFMYDSVRHLRAGLLGLLTLAFCLLSWGAPAFAQQPVNTMHPVFAPLDASGQPVQHTEEVSQQVTCGACHDTGYIAGHTSHAKVGCAGCHLDGGRLEVSPERLDDSGRLLREAIRIGAPRPSNCGACHGVVSGGNDAILLPSEAEWTAPPGDRTWSLTQGEGAVVAPQRMAESFLNLKAKQTLSIPWDIHAAKLVDCAACHYAQNSPVRFDAKQLPLEYVTVDPRRQSMAEFLARPDHRFAEPSCRSCHDAKKAHDFLPFAERHIEVVACQTCHIPGPMGPVVEMVDATVATLSGGPALHYRNVERRAGEPLNAALLKPLTPLLVERAEADGARRLAPVNVLSRFRWVAGGEEVPAAKVAAVFLEGGRYAPAVLAVFDKDHDGQLDEVELRLDTKAKTELVAGRLRTAGLAAPAIEGVLEVYPLAHGVMPRAQALRACEACHASESRLTASFPIAPYLPGGVVPKPAEDTPVELAGKIVPAQAGGLVFQHSDGPAPGRLHVLGQSRHALSNRLGFLLFVAVLVGVTLHATARIVLRRHAHAVSHAAPAATEKSYVFGLYERIWHWTMALSGILLIGTGLEIHGAGRFMPLPEAVWLHNVAAAVLTVNAFLALFYHLATVAIRTFIPQPKGFLKGVIEYVRYQSRGIFYGAPHPEQSPDQKLNPLQQVTYLGLLNVLFPLQIGSGLLLYAVGRWPEVAAPLGGLSVVAPVHNAGAWLFLSFFVLHVYLVTTGRTVGEHLQSMLTGYQTVHRPEQPSS